MRALVVDDARTVRVILRRILEEMGFETVEADNGRDALTWLSEGLPTDVALVDWDMPEMNGSRSCTPSAPTPSTATCAS